MIGGKRPASAWGTSCATCWYVKCAILVLLARAARVLVPAVILLNNKDLVHCACGHATCTQSRTAHSSLVHAIVSPADCEKIIPPLRCSDSVLAYFPILLVATCMRQWWRSHRSACGASSPVLNTKDRRERRAARVHLRWDECRAHHGRSQSMCTCSRTHTLCTLSCPAFPWTSVALNFFWCVNCART